ncbi:glycosyltransferase [Hymenobacter sp. YC55]|uniref:glycosyltransferase n=1 Tax=Hymenobacter sp. YC55 TaxID=3034019 RepID=UPI0023F9AAA1|nr:glycosyltransferase [Hymenobacter sp. YC55]MDF7810189.1 glycosyltransferase [Hymenobacter sp. YC55]
MQYPKLFIIVRNDNNPIGLGQTLESVATQTYESIECLVADNGSDEASLSVIERYSNIITHWVSEKHVALNALTATLLVRATEGYVLVLNSGFTLSEETVVARMLAAGQDQHVLFGNLIKVHPDSTLETLVVPAELDLETYAWKLDNLLQASFIKYTLFQEFDFYDENLVLTTDWTFLLKVLLWPTVQYAHQNITVTHLPVGRHGGTDKLSNNQLAVKEKYWVIENYLPAVIRKLLTDREQLEKTQSNMLRHPMLQVQLRLLSKVSHWKILAVESMKRQYRSIRTMIELPAYRKKFAKECYEIPIIINNRNQLTYLQRLIASLEKRGYKNIYILDNDSNYEPLLKFYGETPYKVFYLGKNVGFCALWDTEIFDYFKDSYYVYTDSDLELVEECPNDFLTVLHYLLNKYPLGKVGLSLLTEDLPAHFANRDEVRQWEAGFQKKKVEILAYQAMVDTTFALYPPNRFGDAGMLYAFRTRSPYSARHLPWYENTSALTLEQKYYYSNAKTSSHWSSKVKLNS